MTSNNSNMANQNQNIKKEELYKWIDDSNLYGTWTFTTQTMTDIGYYKGISYFVIHIMPTPMSGVNSCIINDTSGNNCTEANNYACQYNNERKEECINTETSQVDWSDVTIFFQYGFRLRTGIVHKTYHNVNTGGNWLGPYNIILAKVDDDKEEDNDDVEGEEVKGNAEDETEEQAVFISRYVNTPWTKSQLQRPFQNANIFESNSQILENLIGTKVINTTIQKVQKTWNGQLNSGELNNGTSANASASSIATRQRQRQRQRRRRGLLLRQDDDFTVTDDDEDDKDNDTDPYSKYLQNCDHGDIQPILPRLQLKRTVDKASTISYSMSIDYSILSVPEKGGINNDLYKLWPTMKKHLGTTFPLYGPYCYGKDPNRAYAIRLSFDSEIGKNSTSTSPSSSSSSSSSPPPPLWSGVKGCVPPWPCWNGEPYGPPSPSPSSPTNKIPNDNGNTTGKYVIDPLTITALILYLLGSLLVISLIFNWLLSNRLMKQLQQISQQEQQQQDSLSSSQPPPPSGDVEQEIDRRYDYLEEVVGGNTTSGNGNGNGNDRDRDNNDNNTSNLNDSLEEPLLPSSSSTFNSHNKNNNNAEESFSDYYRNEEEGKNEATTTATTSTNLSTSAPPSGVDESKQES